MTYAELHETLENLKYLNRLSKQEFLDLLFDNDEPTGYYAEMKWVLFQKSPLHFMWSCSSDNIRLLSDYIDFDDGSGDSLQHLHTKGHARREAS